MKAVRLGYGQVGYGRAMKLKALLVSAVVIAALGALAPTAPATAIVGGSSALGNTAVVRLQIPGGVCSGAMWTSRIVITAAHCVTDANGPYANGAIKVFAPGVDTSISAQFVTQSAIVITEDWILQGTFSKPNDIAFLVLPTEIAGGAISRVATTDEVDAFGREGRLVRFLGYGKTTPTSSSVSSPNLIDQKNVYARTLVGIIFSGTDRHDWNLLWRQRRTSDYTGRQRGGAHRYQLGRFGAVYRVVRTEHDWFRSLGVSCTSQARF